MKRKNLYLSTIDEHAGTLAQQYGLGIEIAEFCAACFLDEQLAEKEPVMQALLPCSDRFLLHGPYSELFPCAIDPKIRDIARLRYRQSIAAAQRYGAHKVILHAGYNPRIYFTSWFVSESIVFWKEFVQEIPDGMTVCIENVLETEPNMMTDILEAVDSPKLRMCLDVGHAHAYSSASPETWVRACAPVLDHFHVHNNNGSVDSHQPLYDGTVSMPQLLDCIDQTCPDATITLELMDAESSLHWLEKHNLWEELS